MASIDARVRLEWPATIRGYETRPDIGNNRDVFLTFITYCPGVCIGRLVVKLPFDAVKSCNVAS